MADQLNLDDQANQTVFARVLGCSQPAISKHVQKGTLPAGGTYGEWFNALFRHLQDQAAGRGSSLTDELNRARIDETNMKTANARLDYNAKLGSLVPIDWAVDALRDWASFANREYQSGIRDLVSDIQSTHKIEVSAELIEKHAGTTTRRIADHAQQLVQSSAVGSE
jgi:hypothetical protein